MKVTRIETLRCDAGWRTFSFLKVMTGEGIVGWSEYNESFGSAGLSQVVAALSPVVIGKDPRDILNSWACRARKATTIWRVWAKR